jgi:hypothetical protein
VGGYNGSAGTKEYHCGTAKFSCEPATIAATDTGADVKTESVFCKRCQYDTIGKF